MRRIVALIALVLSSFSLFAQPETPLVFEKPFKPVSPVVAGQGGSFTANGYGFNAFFNNPASLAGKGSFTLLSINPWLYSDGPMLDFVAGLAGVDLSAPSGRALSLASRSVNVTLPPGFVPPEGYVGGAAQFESDLENLLDDFLIEFAPEAAGSVTNVVIPASWTTVDPNTLDSGDLETFMPYVQDLLDANPQLEALIAQELSGPLTALLPPGFPTAPKISFGVSVGIGLIVRGFGLGFATIVDASVAGDTIVQASGDATVTAGFMAGYAHEFKLTDSIGLKVGGLLRPMFRVNAPVKATALLRGFSADGSFDPMSLLESVYANYGTGLGIDVGAILGIGPFGIGLSINDLFDTRFNYHESAFSELYSTFLDTHSLPAGTEVIDARHVVPMNVRLGASFHPNLGGLSFLIDPTIHLEVANFLTLARKAKMASDAGREFKVRIGDIAAFGAEVRLLRFISLRAGYYQGALSAGLGAHLLFVDVNVAAYAVPGSSRDVSSMGDVGVSAELALRF